MNTDSISARFLAGTVLVILILLCSARFSHSQDYEIIERDQSITVQSNSYAVEHHREVARTRSSGFFYQKLIFVNSYIQASNIAGVATLPDGRRIPIGYDDVGEFPVSSSSLITDAKILSVMPGVWLPANSTVTIEYDASVKSLLYLTPWVYTARVPIQKSSCKLTYPADVEIRYYGHDDRIQISKNQLGNRVIVTFGGSARQQLSLAGSSETVSGVEKKVTFMPVRCATDRWILSTESWKSVGQWFAELSAFADQWDASMDAALQPVLAKSTKPEDIAQALYQYIQDHFAYSAIEIGVGGFKPRAAKLTFARKAGDCKDLALLYVAFLHKAGIEAYPALVSTRSANLFNADFPNPRQFDHCIVYLPKIRNGVWVDCTVKKFKLGEIPATIQGRYALVTGGGYDLVQIPADFSNTTLTRIRLDGSLDRGELNVSGSLELPADESYLLSVQEQSGLASTIQSRFLDPLVPIVDLKAKQDSPRVIQLSYSSPVNSVQPYSEVFVDVIKHAPLDFMNDEVVPGKYFALGEPVHKVVEATINLGGRRYPFAKIQKEKKGKYLSYRLLISEDNGKLHYLSDVYFGNGLLDSSGMLEYQTEMKALRSDLFKSVLVQ